MTEKPKKDQMLPADFLEFIADRERQIKQPAGPPKRRQPKITRHQSRRMRQVQGQTRYYVKAVYTEESHWNETPAYDADEIPGTTEVGPGDVNNRTETYRAGKSTVQPATGYNKRYGRSGPRGISGHQDWSAIANLYGN